MSKVSTRAEAARQAFKALGDNPETKAVIAWCEANLGMKVHSNDVSRERYRLKLLTESVQATGNNAVVPSTVTTAGPPQLMTTEEALIEIKRLASKVGGLPRLESLIGFYKSLVAQD